MRLWTIHPRFLDVKGLVALWREGLGAQRSLDAWINGEPGVGYTNHPQLQRFKESDHPAFYLNQYLGTVHTESVERGYNFDLSKVKVVTVPREYQEDFPEMTVNEGQVKYEWDWMQAKLQHRAPRKYLSNLDYDDGAKYSDLIHPLFRIIEGGVESWERV